LPFSLTGPGGRKRRAAAGWSESPQNDAIVSQIDISDLMPTHFRVLPLTCILQFFDTSIICRADFSRRPWSKGWQESLWEK
jgi:hypothetical protein